MEDYLKKQGYYFAHVTLEEGFEDSHDRVVFNITEGPVLHVSNVTFMGESELASTARLNTQVETGKAFLQSFGGKFNDAMVQEDVIKLEVYFKNNGYRNAHVSRELKFSDDFHFVEVIFHIQEGIRFRVQDWSLQGNFASVPREQLENIILTKKGEWYNQMTVSKDVRDTHRFRRLARLQGGRERYRRDRRRHPRHGSRPLRSGRSAWPEHRRPSLHRRQQCHARSRHPPAAAKRPARPNPAYPELKIAEAKLAQLNIFEMNPELGVRPTVTALDSDSEFKDILVKLQETRTAA